MAAASWLTDLVTTWTGTGSRPCLSKERPSGGEPSTVVRSFRMRELPLALGTVLPTSVAAGHRLRGRAHPALTTAVLTFTASVVATNQMLLRYRNAPQIRQHVYVPIACEPYYPGPGTREITSSGCLCAPPRVRQADGAGSYEHLAPRRQPGEIVPLATLADDLEGSADNPPGAHHRSPS
ncbi:hypothetical protein ACFU9Y_00935 [Streptomyces sp. NPDC057621]|uniref:hypothetical protein n=1 Tax=Streptomyces sp. NPDC057621 TaxID=3346186 RepID=UPI003688EDB4